MISIPQLYECILDTKYDLKEELDNFFDSHICIPKGKNRHIDADELHLWIEDTSLKVYCKNTDGGVFQTFNIKTYQPKVHTYFTCIKPSETVYEWQCVLIQEGYPNGLSSFMTEAEIADIHEMVTVIKIDQTKQVRS